MQFLPNGPDIPADLVSLQEKGQTVFVCGAGVSRTIGLPLFRELVEGVYRELGEDWTLHPAEREGMSERGRLARQYDRVLRCLERRLAASDLPRNRGMRGRMRAAVQHVLTPPAEVDYANHAALLALSRDQEGRPRLLGAGGAMTTPGERRTERRLAAILAADVAGYSRLTGLDEEGTHARLQDHLRTLNC